jgi:hypothetical protein
MQKVSSAHTGLTICGDRAADTASTLACRQHDDRSPAKGFAISNNGFLSRWRRDGDGPRSLEKLLKQVEKGTQVRSSGHERVLAELKQHRDDAPDGDLRSALTWLCNAQTRLGSDPTTAHSREVLLAAYEVKRILAVG